MSNPKLRPRVIKLAEGILIGAIKKVDDFDSANFSYVSYAGMASRRYSVVYNVISLIRAFDRSFGVTRIEDALNKKRIDMKIVSGVLKQSYKYGRIYVYTEFDEQDAIVIEYSTLDYAGQQIVAVTY